ncbi:transglycosylase SLT domain-containing protein [Neokomagataea thailandica]|nr:MULTISPECIES: transglycosylase SLT domain-containing protein [Neokomagataea]
MTWRFVSTIFFFMNVPALAYGGDETACQIAVQHVEHESALPFGLLGAISTVESGRHLTKAMPRIAWPWTVNAEGKGYFFPSKQKAIEAVLAFQQRGLNSIDVGCMQINLHHHAEAFSSLEQAFDPVENARYAAHFLKELNSQHRGWFAATAAYHSLTPGLGQDYARHVFAAWKGGDDSYHPPDFLPQVIMTSSGPRVFMPLFATQRPLVRQVPPAFPLSHNSMIGSASGLAENMGRNLASYRRAPTRLWRQ